MVPDVQRSLERLADLLDKIETPLSECMERERASFPRFNFVRDQELLEIIGDKKNISLLQNHVKSMFPGASAIILNKKNNVVLGMSSSEGEKVMRSLCHWLAIFDYSFI